MNRHPLREITADEIRTFEDDGIICVRGVLDDEWIARMQHAVDDILDHPTKFGQDLNDTGEAGTLRIRQQHVDVPRRFQSVRL